ncbi:hypothetical protein BLSTO_05027 [Blastocystis sp. subtype 1]
MIQFNYWNAALLLMILIHFHFVQYCKKDGVSKAIYGTLQYDKTVPPSRSSRLNTMSDEEPILNIKYPMKPAVETFTRLPFKTEPRTKFNDLFPITYDAEHMAKKGEYDFRQDYTLKYFVGSALEATSRRKIELLSYDHYDISIISQTTKERLFYFNHMLKRWQGPISITIIQKNESAEVERFIRQSHFPNRLRLALYTIGVSNNPDCVYHLVESQMKCIPQIVYPLNRLRNIAIENIVTSHFVVFDMDMWPAKMVYSTLLSLPQSYFENPYNVMIIPAFSLAESVLNPENCTGLRPCVKKSPFLS